jgi:hypothetical protein
MSTVFIPDSSPPDSKLVVLLHADGSYVDDGFGVILDVVVHAQVADA